MMQTNILHTCKETQKLHEIQINYKNLKKKKGLRNASEKNKWSANSCNWLKSDTKLKQTNSKESGLYLKQISFHSIFKKAKTQMLCSLVDTAPKCQ